MPLIGLPDGTTKEDERKNGTKLKLSNGDWIRLIVIAVTFIASAVGGWTYLKAKVSYNGIALAEQKEKNKDQDSRLEVNKDNALSILACNPVAEYLQVFLIIC